MTAINAGHVEVVAHAGASDPHGDRAASQPLDSDLTAIAALSTTSFGRSFLALADAGAGRTLLALGTAATAATGDFDAAGAAAAAQAASQPLDSDLTAIAALTTTAYGRALLALADAAALRTAAALGTAATADTGTGSSNVPTITQADARYDATGAAAAAQAASQPLDSDLTAIAALSTTSFGRALLALADAAAGRTAFGLGTAATHAATDFDTSGAAAAVVSDVAYDATTWDGVTTVAPSKNAIRDHFESLPQVASSDVVKVPLATAGGFSTFDFSRLAAMDHTAVKTSSFSINPGDFSVIDSTSGAVVATLPSAPLDNTVVWAHWYAGTNAASFARGGSDTIDGIATTLAFSFAGQVIGFSYDAANTTWRPIASLEASRVSYLQTLLAPLTPTVGTGLGTTGTVNLDMAALHGTIQTITLTGNPTFTTSNRAAGRLLRLRLAAGGSTRTIVWPSWVAYGAALPTSLASGKSLVLSLVFEDSTDAAAQAAVAVQP